MKTCKDCKYGGRMREYERLTKQKWSNEIDLTQELGYSHIYQRLYELENILENGRLIELPCKVGDTVYVLREDSFAEDNYKKKWHIAEGFVKKIYINTKNEIFLQIISWVDHKLWSKDSRNYKISTFGKTIFLTKAEAEAKLKELRGE